MRKRFALAVALAVSLTLGGSLAAAAAARPDAVGGLQMYRAVVGTEKLQELAATGIDFTVVDQRRRGAEVALVLTGGERQRLATEDVELEIWRDSKGRTQQRRARMQRANGFNVYRPYDGANGIEAEIRRLARRKPQIAELRTLGTSHQGRPILAIRMTQGVRDVPVGSRPGILYQGTAHAREWISTEVARRLMHWYADGFPRNKEVHEILKTTELWFVPVVNPDGYQYTFDGERLWRKNLRDNNGNGTIEPGDGVDLNRNLPEHWNYDEEGSSSEFSSETYRGPAPVSEPETEANMAIFDQADLRFTISYHSFGQLLLYPQGWQVQTPSADDPIYVALTGTDEQPAVPGFDPDVSAELYTTNGEFTDWAHGAEGVLAWTPELSEGCQDCGFVFPDDEQLIEEEFRNNLDFAVRVAQSAGDPDDPVSHFGVDTADFYLDVSGIDPYKANNPLSDLAVDVSYAAGGSQPVEVLAKRSTGEVTLHYRVNGGAAQTAPTGESADGERYGGNNAYDTYYHYLRGEIPGLAQGDTVEYWFSGDGSESEHGTFEVVAGSDARVLLLAAEDRTGLTNIPGYASTSPDEPNFLAHYAQALTVNGIAFDVYDVDAMGREAPDHLGVLSHYDAVVWYTGNDLVTREQGWTPGNSSRLANDMMLELREHLNGGGKLVYTGQWAGATENGVAGAQFYDPVANEQCVIASELVLDRCQLLADKNDFLQYYLGAYAYNSDAGTDPETGEPRPVEGTADPYGGMTWEFNGDDSAANQVHTASFLTTSSILDPLTFPQFESSAPAIWSGAGGTFEPFDGEQYVYSQQANVSYKRLVRTIDLTGVAPVDAPTLTFRTSYDTEPAWDFTFVEAHTVGQDDWTTLPDMNGHTSSDTGESCPAGWHELHPWLERYQTFVPADPNDPDSEASCTPGGTGEWHAHSGRSAGWEQWQVDLSAYAGQQVEVSISYASDWAVQGLGAFVDQIEVSDGDGSTSFEDDADPMDGWTVPGPPPGSAANANDWTRTGSVGFEEGAIVQAADTLYFGFGVEGVTGAADRAEILGRSIDHLLD